MKKHKNLILGGIDDIRRSNTPDTEETAMENDVAIRTKLGFSLYVFDSHARSPDYLDDSIERGDVYQEENIQLWIDDHSDTYLQDRRLGYSPGFSAISMAEKGNIDWQIWVSRNPIENNEKGEAALREHVKVYDKLNMESGYFSWSGRSKNRKVVMNICSDIAPFLNGRFQSDGINSFLKRLFEEDGLVPSVVHISTSPSAVYDNDDVTYGDIGICREIAEFIISDDTLRMIERNAMNPGAQEIAIEESSAGEGCGGFHRINMLIRQAA